MGFFGPSVTRMKKKGNIPGIVEALVHLKPKVRRAAAEALWEFAEEERAGDIVRAGGLQALMVNLEDSDWETGVMAAFAIGGLAAGGEVRAVTEGGAIKTLLGNLQDTTGTRRMAALQALWYIAGNGQGRTLVEAGGLKVLGEALRDRDEMVRAAAADTFIEIVKNREYSGEEEPGKDFSGLLALVRTLDCNDKQMRETAVRAMGELLDASAVRPLRELMEVEECECVRQAAAQVLENLTGKTES